MEFISAVDEATDLIVDSGIFGDLCSRALRDSVLVLGNTEANVILEMRNKFRL